MACHGPSSRFCQLLDELKDCHLKEVNNALPSWLLGEVAALRSELAQTEPTSLALRGEQNGSLFSGTTVHESLCEEDEHQVPAEPILPLLPGPSSGDAHDLKAPPLRCLQEGPAGEELNYNDLALIKTNDQHRVSNIVGSSESKFNLRETWACRQKIRQSVRETNSTQLDDVAYFSEHEQVEEVLTGACKHLVAVPGSKCRLCWDMLGGMLIFYDVVYIPTGFFDPPEIPFTIFMDWCTLLFWTLNVPATLTVGYVEAGLTIIDPKKIARNYLKSWFLIDVFTLVPDWTFTMVAAGGVGDSMKLLRTLRLTRTVRLLRLVKLRRIAQSITDSLDSEYSSLIFNIWKMMVILIAVNHLIACLWFGLGTTSNGTSHISWIKEYEISDASFATQYLVSLHWSLTQFTPASMNVQPVTEGERAFAVCVLLFALVGFAYVVGSITGSLAQLRALTEKTSKDLWLLRRFLRRNGVPKTLGLRIQRYIEHMHGQQQTTMSMQQVVLLSMLSKQLTDELQCSINLPQLSIHPLFAHLQETSFITMSRLAKEAVNRSHMARGDTLFLPDQHGTCMYMIASGEMQYKRTAIWAQDNKTEVSEIVEVVSAMEDWMSEPVIWTDDWYHLGHAISLSECEILTIPSAIFADVLCRVKPVAALVAQYGRQFIAWVEELRRQNILSDVIQGDQVNSLIASFIPPNTVV